MNAAIGRSRLARITTGRATKTDWFWFGMGFGRGRYALGRLILNFRHEQLYCESRACCSKSC